MANRPLRVCLNETSVSGVRRAIQDAGEFDWHNAEAGRLRDTMDFVIGGTLNHVIRQIPGGERRSPGFTVGRVGLLALDCLCRRWLEAGQFKTRGYIFLLFPGAGDRSRIDKDMHEGSALAVSVELQRGPYSQSGLLRELLRWDVGTVSTRYKMIASLLRQDLIRENGQWLAPSPKGLAVEQHLLKHLESPNFSLWQWQHRMAQFLASADSRVGTPLPELERQVDDFLQEFLVSFRSVLDSCGSAVQKLWDALNTLPPEDQAQKLVTSNDESYKCANHQNLNGLGMEGAVSMDELASYVNIKGNSLSTNGSISISRRMSQPERDWDGMLRRLLLLEREVAFRLVDSVNLNRFLELEAVPYTLFRADCDIRKLPEVLRYVTRPGAKIDKPLRLEVKVSTDEPSSTKPHPPLEIFDPCPADMWGPDALLVAKEYMRPYEYTINLLDAQESGQELLSSFQCGKLDFCRVDPFEFGTAHTFDTLLATMYDRYAMPFETTAQIAESLYLGGAEF